MTQQLQVIQYDTTVTQTHTHCFLISIKYRSNMNQWKLPTCKRYAFLFLFLFFLSNIVFSLRLNVMLLLFFFYQILYFLYALGFFPCHDDLFHALETIKLWKTSDTYEYCMEE